MPATLKLERHGVGIELHRGSFEVLIDGERVGSIDHGGALEVPVGPGQHTLQVRKGRYSSPARTFAMADEELAIFRCYGANIWVRWLASLALPSLAIALRRQ